jgi:hypothetical protein
MWPCARTIGRPGETGSVRLLGLVADGNEAGTALLAALERDPGAVGLDSLLTEITRLNDVRKLGLPDGRAHPRQHPAGSASPGRTGLGIAAERGGPAPPDRAVLVQRQPVRHLPLDMEKRLDLGPAAAVPGPRTPADTADRSRTETQ